MVTSDVPEPVHVPGMVNPTMDLVVNVKDHLKVYEHLSATGRHVEGC